MVIAANILVAAVREPPLVLLVQRTGLHAGACRGTAVPCPYTPNGNARGWQNLHATNPLFEGNTYVTGRRCRGDVLGARRVRFQAISPRVAPQHRGRRRAVREPPRPHWNERRTGCVCLTRFEHAVKRRLFAAPAACGRA